MSAAGSQQIDNTFTISCRRLDDVEGLDSLMHAGSGHGVVLALSGEVDLCTAPVAEDELRRAEASQDLIVLDLRAVSFMDSTGIRMLVAADRRNRERGAALVIVQGTPQIRRLFELSGLTQHLELLDGDNSEPSTPD
jgi:anti-sigma B factor antagonist